VSALLIAFFIKDERAESIVDETDGRESPSYLREVWEGVQWIVADRRLTQVLVSASITMTLIAALMVVIMQVYAEAVFDDPVSLGVLVAGFGLGSLLGSFGFGYLANRLDSWTTYLIATAVVGVPFMLLALEPSLVVATILDCLVGIAFGPIIPCLYTPIQQRTNDSIRGRVFSTRFALNSIIKLPNLLFIGAALESRGIAPTLLILGIVSLVMVAYLAVRRTNEQVVPNQFNSQVLNG
jgi:MFS family permease